VDVSGDARIGGQDDERRRVGQSRVAKLMRSEIDARRLRSQSVGVPYYRRPLTTPARESRRPMSASTA
jgi:hypothetical protein